MAVATDTDHDLVTQVLGYYNEAHKKRASRKRNWDRNYKVVNNRTFAEGRPAWMPDTRVSECFPILAALVGWMTDQRSSIEVTPSADPHSSFFEMESKLAHDLQKLMEALWITKDWDRQVEQVLWDAMIYGTGFFKVVWEQAEDEGQGQPMMKRVDPYKLFPDPAADTWEEISFVIEENRMSLDDLDRRYGPGSRELVGEVGSGSVDRRPDVFGNSSTEAMANPGNMPGSTATAYGNPGQGRERVPQGPGVVVYEAWLRENELWLDDDGEEYTQDRWRFVVICGDVVLADENVEDMWGYAGHPYTRFVYQDMGEVWGVALVDHLYPVQASLNALVGAVQNNLELCGNPVAVRDRGSGLERQNMTNKPGKVLDKNKGYDFTWMPPPPLQSQFFQMIQFYESSLERISGLSAIVRGHGPQQRAAQGVMDQVQESAFVRVRAGLRNLERSLRASGEMVASLIVENYDAPRTVAIVGPNGDQTSMALATRHFYTPGEDDSGPLKYQLWVRAGAQLPTSRQARAMEADALFAMGALDREAVLEAHDYPNRTDIVERLRQRDMAGLMAGGAGAGGPNARQRSRRKV